MDPQTPSQRSASAARLPSAASQARAREALLAGATESQQQVMQRIAMQRERLRARSAARVQAVAIKAGSTQSVRPDAPLLERIVTFARLHPVALAVLGMGALAIGPGRLVRVGATVLPWIMRWRQR